MSDLSYPHLRYFWMVSREGNLTRAARKLRVSQSAVSVQLKKLEDALGHRLFERKGRGLELTRVGRVALYYANQIFDLGDEMLAIIEDEEQVARRTLAVGALATLSRNFQIGFLGPLFDREDVVVSVRSGPVEELIRRLAAHEIDVVLSNYVPARTAEDRWVTHTIDQQAVSLIGRPPVRSQCELTDLLREEALVVPSADSGIRSAFDALVDRLGVRPRVLAEVDDMAMLRLVARRHWGLAVIPPIVVQDEIEAGSLVEHAQLPGIFETFVAISMPRPQRSPLLNELLGFDEDGPSPSRG